MGTRAAFWLGDPRNIENRKWLGCIAWDGHPDGDCKTLFGSESDEEFVCRVQQLAATRDDFATPERGWPFPWSDDIFLTDFTYAFFDGAVQVSCYHRGFVSADKALGDDPWPGEDDPTCSKVPAGKAYDRSQPDSIMIFSIPK